MLYGSTGAITLAEFDTVSQRYKHIDVVYHMIRDNINKEWSL